MTGERVVVEPVVSLSDEVNDIRVRTAAIVNELILPAERSLLSQSADTIRDTRSAVVDRVKREGLWAPHLPHEFGGMGIGVVAHASMNEILAYSPAAAPLFGIVAPNAGNQELLARLGTDEQKERWLRPLVEGTIQSAFSMTEPDTPGSDPRSLATTACRDGDEWVIDGHKWFTSNGGQADVYVVMCRLQVSPGEPPGNDMVQVLVPADTPGVERVRAIGLWGEPASDHWEMRYRSVRVPLENAIGGHRQGHAAAQLRLGAGRVYHCMTAVGQMRRAFDLMVHRARTREVHRGRLADKQLIQGFIADSYIDIQTARLMTLDAAAKVERGDPAARIDISAIKLLVPQAWHRVADRAIQVWGAAGFTTDLPLGASYLGARLLRIADGPDEVHRILVAKQVLGREGGWPFGR